MEEQAPVGRRGRRAVGRLVRVAIGLVVVALAVAIVAGGGLLALVFGRALPQASGTLRLAGLSAPVTVYRDAAGIVQIVAATPDDLFFAQGYVHASERMWQMEVWRRIGAGRLSELFGSSALDKDIAIRTMGWRQAGEADYAAASPRTRRVLDQYAEGVNAWLAQNKGRLGFPFVVAGLKSGTGGLGGYDPEPWTGVDSTTFAKLQAWSLGGNLQTEIFKSVMDTWLGGRTDLTDLLVPPYQPGMPVIVNAANGTPVVESTGRSATDSAARAPAAPAPARAAPASAATPGVGTDLARFADLGASISAAAGLGSSSPALDHAGIGSNDWVVAPSKTSSHTALLANDPHLGIQMPSVWFMNGLRCVTVSPDCPYDVVGVSFPGTPAVILGHNARIAWGATNVNPDVEDLFVETPDPADPGHYLYAGRSLPFATRDEVIGVAGGDAVRLTVRSTVHGPVISDLYDDLEASGKLYALRWTALAEPDGLLDSFVGIDTAGDFQQFREALRSYGAPSQNFVYADVDGNIGYQVPGRIPIRPAGVPGDRPVAGSSGAADWTGYIPFDDLPTLYNPPSGIIVTANNKVADASYPYHLGDGWDPGWRATRIRQMLDDAVARGGVSQADLSRIQNDKKLLRAESVIPTLLAVTPASDDGRAVQDLVRRWDGTCPADSHGCAAYEVTDWRLQRALFEPWVRSQARVYIGSDPANVALRIALADPASPFWDDPATRAVETRESRAAAALDAAGTELRAALGSPSRWAWGRLHRATFKEQTLGSSGIGPIEAVLNAGPFALGGTADAVDNTQTTPSAWYPDPSDPGAGHGTLLDAFAAGTIPSYRLTVDLGNLDAATIIQTTGQSGNPLDRHYGDLIDDWIAGRTVPLPFSPDAVRRSAVSTLVLSP